MKKLNLEHITSYTKLVQDLNEDEIIIAISITMELKNFVLRYDDFGDLSYGIADNSEYSNSWLVDKYKLNNMYFVNLFNTLPPFNMGKNNLWIIDYGEDYFSDKNILALLGKMFLRLVVGKEITLPNIQNKLLADKQIYPLSNSVYDSD